MRHSIMIKNTASIRILHLKTSGFRMKKDDFVSSDSLPGKYFIIFQWFNRIFLKSYIKTKHI